LPDIRAATATALIALCALAPTAVAHEGNPNYNSEVTSIAPAVDGLEAEVLGGDDRVELRNGSDSVVVVEGYDGEPYLRFLPGGTVEVNRRSPAFYLNEDRFAQVRVPSSASPRAKPSWNGVSENGRYDWHDHRIHWMSKTPPEQVRKDESRRAKIFDWKLALSVAGQPAAVKGRLTWLGKDDGGPPLAAALSLAAAVLSGAALVLFVRRRRRSSEPPRPMEEAW
jgi:hypothetical protein